MKLQGTANSKTVTYIKFLIKACDSKDPNQKCQSEKVLDEKLNGCALLFYYVDKYFEPEDYLNPTKYYFNYELIPLSKKVYNGFILTLKKYNFLDNVGFIFDDVKTTEIVKIDRLSKSFDFRQGEAFIEFLIIFSQNISKMNRKYKKIQEIIAQVGGLVNIFNLITNFFVIYFSQRDYFDHISEKYFNTSKKINSPLLKKKSNNYCPKNTDVQLKVDNYLNNNDLAQDSNLAFNSGKKLSAKTNKIIAIKKLIDPEHIIKMTKELQLLKILILEGPNYDLFQKLIKNKNSGGNLLLYNNWLNNFKREEARNFNENINKYLLKINEFIN